MPNPHDSRSRSDSAPAAGRGGTERESEGCGASSLCPSLELTTPDSSSSSPLHSVLSSRCQEVAQCLFFFVFFLFSSFERLHDFTRLFIFVLRSRRSRLLSQRVSGRFVCLCHHPVPQSLDSLIRSSGSSWSVVTKTTRTQGTVYGRIRDTLHYRVHP